MYLFKERVKKEGKAEILNFIKTKFGGFPLFDGALWNDSNLNKTKLFEQMPFLIQKLFHLGPRLENTENGLKVVTVRKFYLIKIKFDKRFLLD